MDDSPGGRFCCQCDGDDVMCLRNPKAEGIVALFRMLNDSAGPVNEKFSQIGISAFTEAE